MIGNFRLNFVNIIALVSFVLCCIKTEMIIDFEFNIEILVR